MNHIFQAPDFYGFWQGQWFWKFPQSNPQIDGGIRKGGEFSDLSDAKKFWGGTWVHVDYNLLAHLPICPIAINGDTR